MAGDEGGSSEFSMPERPSLDGIEEVMISRQVVEGAAGPLYMYAARAGGAKAT